MSRTTVYWMVLILLCGWAIFSLDVHLSLVAVPALVFSGLPMWNRPMTATSFEKGDVFAIRCVFTLVILLGNFALLVALPSLLYDYGVSYKKPPPFRETMINTIVAVIEAVWIWVPFLLYRIIDLCYVVVKRVRRVQQA